jgi:uncharacterized protein (TIGR00297 family)
VLDIPRIVAGLALSALIGGLAYRRGSLTSGGWAGAILTGTLTFGLGGWTWGLTLIAFFVSSSALSHHRRAAKERVAGEKFEKGGRRDLWQALANGGAGAALAVVYALAGAPALLLAAYAGIMATVTADTWATEIGVLSRTPPRLITTMRPTAPGASGGVSALGMLASAAGALFIGLVMLALAQAEGLGSQQWLATAALLGGVLGSLTDSLLGATVQAMYLSPAGETERRASRDGAPYTLLRGWRWMNNDGVNFLSSLAGGLVGAAIYALLAR